MDTVYLTQQRIPTFESTYYAIMYPLNSRWTKSRGPVILVMIWIVSLILSSVQLIHGRADQFTWAGQVYLDCREIWNETDGKIYTAVIFLITFLVPMLILTFTYSSVGWKMWRHTSPGNADPTRDQHQLMAKLKVVKMLATVVFLFAVCWLPIQILNLLIYFHKDLVTANHDSDILVYHATFFTCHWLSMSNSFINPVIYCFMSDNFRVDLKQLVFCHRKRKPEIREKLTIGGHSSSCSSFRTSTSILMPSSHPHQQLMTQKAPPSVQAKPIRFYRTHNGSYGSQEF